MRNRIIKKFIPLFSSKNIKAQEYKDSLRLYYRLAVKAKNDSCKIDALSLLMDNLKNSKVLVCKKHPSLCLESNYFYDNN